MPILNYRDILREEYYKRRETDSNYTLRSFSEDCGLPPSRMSDILNKRYGISKKKGEMIVKKINLDKTLSTLFLTSVEAEHARSKSVRDIAQKKLKRLLLKPDRIYSDKEINSFLNWYDLAVVELMRHPNFKNDLPWLSKKLNISFTEIKEIVEKLVNVRSISIFNENYRVNYDFFSTSSQKTSVVLQKYHAQILDLTKKILTQKSVEHREMSSISFLCDPNDMQKIKERIKTFKQELVADFETNSIHSDLYVLNIQFFSPTED